MPWIVQILYAVHSGNSGGGGASTLGFALGVLPFMMPDALLPKNRPGLETLVNAVLLPLNYFMELGFYFVVGWLGVRQLRRKGLGSRADLGAVALGVGSLVISTFVNMTVISNQDLIWRSALIVQFVLLLWAAEMWDEGTIGFGFKQQKGPGMGRRAAPVLVTVTLVLGLVGSAYELFMQRTFPILSDAFPITRFHSLSLDQQLGRRTYAMRSAYVELDRMLPASAVVQADPTGGIGNEAAELYSGRQMVADAGDCGTVFGGSAEYCKGVILPRLKPLFDDKRPVSMGEVEQTCREFSITALLFEDTDPVWKDKSSWIWQVRPMVSNPFVRVIACGGAVGTVPNLR